MLIKKYCYCCDKVADTYKNTNTGKVAGHCVNCGTNLSKNEREKQKFNNILNIISTTGITN